MVAQSRLSSFYPEKPSFDYYLASNMIEQQQIQISFSYKEGRFPTYSNAVLINIVADGTFLLDFGFIDPLAISESKHEIQPTSRILITRDTAEQLVTRLSSFLNTAVEEIISES